MDTDIILLHAYGQSAYSSAEVLAYGSLDNLMASDVLAGIPNREKSLTQLWEAANVPDDVTDGQEEEGGGDAERG